MIDNVSVNLMHLNAEMYGTTCHSRTSFWQGVFSSPLDRAEDCANKHGGQLGLVDALDAAHNLAKPSQLMVLAGKSKRN